MRKTFYILPVCLALCMATGCVMVSPETLAGLTNANSRQPVPPKVLDRPTSSTARQQYAATNANRTLVIPIALEMLDATTFFSVMEENVFGYAENVGAFQGGELVEAEFQKVVEANFHQTQGDEVPVAKFCVRVIGISLRKHARSDMTEANLRIQVEIRKNDAPDAAFSKVFSASSKMPWQEKHVVPVAFYDALDRIVGDFLAQWDASGALATLLKWNGEANPGVVSPELKVLEWTKKGDEVWVGHCEVDCNGYEGFKAKDWAKAQIAAACRTKLGNIEPERVRVLYDEEDSEKYDDEAKKWTFKFRTFGRSEMVLYFTKESKRGLVIGDLELMNLKADEAAEKLKNYVFSQMGSHVGVVSQGAEQPEVWVRFDDYKTDKTYNLITITFRLVN